jgi:hypothetical protein
MPRDLRSYARGKPCQVRLPGICTHDTETTVLAHPRLAGITGVGMKAPDELGAWCCGACHDAIDRRAHTDLDRDYVTQAHYEGILRTQAALLREEVLVTVL